MNIQGNSFNTFKSPEDYQKNQVNNFEPNLEPKGKEEMFEDKEEEVLEFSKNSEEKSIQFQPSIKRSEKWKIPMTGAEFGNRTTASILSIATNSATPEICAISFDELAWATKVGLSAIKLFENNKTIENARNEIDNLEKLIESAENEEDTQDFQKQIKKFRNDIEVEVEKKSTTIEMLVTNSTQGTLKGVYKATDCAAKILQTGCRAAPSTLLASSITGNVLSVLIIILSSKVLNSNRQLVEKISSEILHIENELEKAIEDAFFTEILQLRLRNLKRQQEENKINITKNVFSLLGGCLGLGLLEKVH